jgi:hypothetical protein
MILIIFEMLLALKKIRITHNGGNTFEPSMFYAGPDAFS